MPPRRDRHRDDRCAPALGDASVNWPEFLLVLAAAILAACVVPAAYVVWARVVGLEPRVAKWWADLPKRATMPAGLAVGAVLGVGTSLAPSVETGVAAVVLVASSTLAGLLLFEFYAERAA